MSNEELLKSYSSRIERNMSKLRLIAERAEVLRDGLEALKRKNAIMMEAILLIQDTNDLHRQIAQILNSSDNNSDDI